MPPELARFVNNGLPVLLTKFLTSRRQGISERTTEFYEYCLKPFVENYRLTPEGINRFLADLTCGNAKHAYYRALKAFCNWVTEEGYIEYNPIKRISPPKTSEPILPSLTPRQVEYLIDVADNTRDRCMISLFADCGMRLSELASVKADDIDWQNYTVTIWGKGNKQRKAPFTKRTARLLRRVIAENSKGSDVWHIEPNGIQLMLQKLKQKTGLPCNPHTFRRTFASNLHRAGIDIEHIMRLGGWSSLDMVLTYTKSVKFEDSLRIYKWITSALWLKGNGKNQLGNRYYDATRSTSVTVYSGATRSGMRSWAIG
ncbi:MAG: tyrosine-type recombinase/integrase [Chloroflexi bacterium]|nr:tyrosine-type recombinase/integrase [Chloroflexota bacterium]